MIDIFNEEFFQVIKNKDFQNIVKYIIYNSYSILDIGCGIADYLKYTNNNQRVVGVEPHLPYILKAREVAPWVEYVNKDALDFFSSTDEKFDCILLIDVIEHLEEDDAIKLVEEAKKHCKGIIFSQIPIGIHEQNEDVWNLGGEFWQTHRSTWVPENIDKLGFSFLQIWNEWYDWNHKDKRTSIAFWTEHPLVSIVIPTYNQAQYLTEALDSLLAQTFQNWEAIIVNDGSTDNTKEVIEKYLLLDKRFKAVHKQNGGVASALNMGIKHAKGEWICWLSSDDLFEPNKLEIHFNAIKENPDIKFFHSHWYLLLEETKQKIAPGLWLQIPPTDFQVIYFFWANYIHGNAIAVHKSVFDDVGLFDETLRQGQDFDMWLRISSKYKSHFINERTCVTRIHKGQTTNSFLEGGVLDSTRALIKFLNEKNFYDLFPFTDFNLPQNILKAINEIIYISTKQDAFLYRCGYTTALVEKTMNWFTSEVPISFRDKLFPFIKNIVKKYLEEPFIPEIKSILKGFISYKKVIFQHHDFIKDTINYAKELILYGDQKQARAIETYLIKILNIEKKNESSENLYKPILLGFPTNNEYEQIDPENIIRWEIEPSGMVRNSIKHYIKMNCNNCNMNFNIQFEYEMDSYYSSQNFVCPGCKKGFQYDDKNFSEDFLKFHYKKINEIDNTKTSELKVGFFIRDASILGGGTKVFFNYINWLLILGADVTVYSFSKKPDWVKTKVKYVHIQNELEIKTVYSIFFVFSIFDLPFILNRIPIHRVVHICQGYEGYHFGRDYNETRSDKHILTQLHAIPVKNILVSTHLIELFNSKFEKEYEYIPNGIDHKIFSFVDYKNREKSILFVGNPFHPLKGFSFLASAIKIIQQSSLKIEHLKLYIIMGFKPDNLDQIIKQLSEELLCEIDIKVKLDSSNVAKLMQSSSIVVCTSWYEGFALPLLEAMACGTPVITTYNGGAESFCKNEFNSIIVNYGDINSLSQSIVDIIYDTKDMNKLIKNAYQTSKHYSEYNSVNQFISAMEKLMKTQFQDQNKKELINKYISPELEINDQLFFGDFKVSIIIPVYNQLTYTKNFIESLKITVNNKTDLIIIDNASKEPIKEYLSTVNFKNMKLNLISNKENLGFPIAINQGILEADGKYILIANNDIVVTDGWLDRMIEVLESDPKIGIVGPISNEVSGLQKDNNAKYNSIEEMHKYAAEVQQKNKGEILHFPRVAFLCTLIKREVIDKIGGLDERFSPGNFEDDDFCLRAQLAGYKTVIAKDVFIHHYGSKSFKANGLEEYKKRLEINRQIFIDKWGADPDEIWLKNKPIKKHQIYYPIDKNLFKQHLERTRILIADSEINLAQIEIEKAINSFEETSSELISYTELLNLAGNLFLATNDFEKAKSYFEKELETNPSSSSACFGLGQIFFAQDNYEAAKVMFEWAIKNDSQNQQAINSLQNVNEILGFEINHNSLMELNNA